MRIRGLNTKTRGDGKHPLPTASFDECDAMPSMKEVRVGKRQQRVQDADVPKPRRIVSIRVKTPYIRPSAVSSTHGFVCVREG